MLLDACGGSSISTRSLLHKLPPPARSTDVEILNRLLDLEYRTVAAYTAGTPLLNKRQAKAAQQFLQQELSHAGELSGLVKEAGAKPLKQRSSYQLGSPGSGRDVLRLLHALEIAQLRAYLEAIPTLSPGPVRAVIASILANDAQHVSVLRAALGEAPLPAALVTGGE
jgi:hypothetical protein